MKNIDFTPTPNEYLIMLNYIMDYSTNKHDVIWAKNEVAKIKKQQHFNLINSQISGLTINL
jgi:hypothetical protein